MSDPQINSPVILTSRLLYHLNAIIKNKIKLPRYMQFVKMVKELQALTTHAIGEH